MSANIKALEVIDEFLKTTTGRSIMPSSELQDFALELRFVLQSEQEPELQPA